MTKDKFNVIEEDGYPVRIEANAPIDVSKVDSTNVRLKVGDQTVGAWVSVEETIVVRPYTLVEPGQMSLEIDSGVLTDDRPIDGDIVLSFNRDHT
jgi:hypothetical protein